MAAIDAALERGEIDEEGWHRAMAELVVPAYLAGDNPRAQSGHSGDAQRWEGARRLLLDAVERPGSFLDIGCANGHLMECLHAWAAEDGIDLEPWGLEISSDLAEMARQRLPHWRDRISVGNALDWRPPGRFTYVRTNLDYVPAARRAELLHHLLDEVVARDGRLIVGVFNEELAGVIEESVELVGLRSRRASRATSSRHVEARSPSLLDRRSRAVGTRSPPAKFGVWLSREAHGYLLRASARLPSAPPNEASLHGCRRFDLCWSARRHCSSRSVCTRSREALRCSPSSAWRSRVFHLVWLPGYGRPSSRLLDRASWRSMPPTATAAWRPYRWWRQRAMTATSRTRSLSASCPSARSPCCGGARRRGWCRTPAACCARPPRDLCPTCRASGCRRRQTPSSGRSSPTTPHLPSVRSRPCATCACPSRFGPCGSSTERSL